MIKAIQIKNGALFVEWGGFSTYRYTEKNGWEVSPCLFLVVERDMQYEGPDAFDYLAEGEIRARDDFDALCALHKKTCEILGWNFEEENKMKVMTFNTQHCLNYLEQKIDFDVMADAILSLDPDVVGLNEMRGEGENPEYTEQVKILAEKTGMPYYYFAPAIVLNGEGPYGNGFLSKIPILRAETVIIPDPVPHKYNGYYETRCVLKADLANGVTVLVSHFGLNPDEAENAVRTVVANLAKEKCVLMGDFNLTPDNAILLPIREKMKDTADLFEGEKLSFPSDTPRMKIDYIFVSPDVTVLSADIPAKVASDHRPHVAEIKF